MRWTYRIRRKKSGIPAALLAAAIFLGALALKMPSAAAEKKEDQRVLFISSYAYDWESVPKQIEGIRSTLDKDVSLHYLFMNTKNMPEQEAKNQFYKVMELERETMPEYDVIILGDDPALDFVMEHREEFFSGIPCVFEGINSLEKVARASVMDKMTGVAEVYPLEETIRLAADWFPGAARVLAVTDDTVSGIGSLEQFYDQKDKFPGLRFEHMNCSRMSEEEIILELSDVGDDTIVIYLMLTENSAGERYSLKESIDLMRQYCRAPAFKADELGVGGGLAGGKVISYEDMGKKAGRMAQSILDGTEAGDIPVEQAAQKYLLDVSILRQYGIGYNQIPIGAELINDKRQILLEYRSEILLAAVFLLFLLLMLGYTMLDNMRRRRLLQELRRKEELLNESEVTLRAAIRQSQMDIWQYFPAERRAIHNMRGPAGSEGIVVDNFPENYPAMKEIFPEDVPKFLSFHKLIEQGNFDQDCDIRIVLNNTFHWVRIHYLPYRDDSGRLLKAIGIRTDITEQKEVEQRFEEESARRAALEKDVASVSCYNLARNLLLEAYSEEFECPEAGKNVSMDDALRFFKTQVLMERNCDELERLYSIEELRKAYTEGRRQFSAGYARRNKAGRLRFVRTDVSLVEQPVTGEALAYFYTYDVHNEKLREQVFTTILEEDVDLIACIDVETRELNALRYRNGEYEFAESSKDYDTNIELFVSIRVLPSDRQMCVREMQFANLLSRLEQQPVFSVTYCIADEQGHVRRKNIRYYYLNRRRKTIVMTRRDITDFYEEEQKRNELLERALEDAKQASRAKSEFLSRMSHEIRTPMNAIIGLTDMSLQKCADEGYIRDKLIKIQDSAHYLLLLINDILDISRIESGKMTLQEARTDFSAFLSEVDVLVGEGAREKGIHYIRECRGEWENCYCFDSLRVKQVLVNILSNAVKFTPGGGSVEFLVICGKPRGMQTEITFVVRDTGIGIRKEFLPRIFEAFEQQEGGNTASYGGSGLGLAISKRIVDMMGGSVKVDSEENKGTESMITIPFRRVSEGMRAAEQSNPFQGQEALKPVEYDFTGKRVLLAEDNEINREIATSMLEEKGFEVEAAENGLEAVEKYEKNVPGYYSVVLLDIRMPVMDGLEAAGRIRNAGRADSRTVPIVAMTANAFEEDRKKCLDAGMNEHIGKPVEAQKLYGMLNKLL